jgi:hypothetical protein
MQVDRFHHVGRNSSSHVAGASCAWSIVMLACVGVVAGPFAGRAEAATTYYVSSSGNDSNGGSEVQPFRTIQRAANIVNPGDTVIVEDGVYTGTGAGTSCASSASRPIVCLTRGGTSASVVTFKARNVGGAKLDGQHNTSTEGFRFLSSANYIRIEGFEIYGIGNASGSANAFEIYNGGHDVVIARNHIHDIGRVCTDTTNGQAGFFVQQPRVTITRNVIHDIGRFAPGESGCSPTTAYYKNHDHGVYVDGQSEGSSIPGAADALITDNIFYNHGRGWAIQAYPGSLVRLSILNNTFAFPSPYVDGHIVLGANTSDGRILNNVFYKPRNSAIYYYTGTQTNLQIVKNVVYGATVITTTPSGTTLSGNKTADPLLVNTSLAPYDFHLTAISPAIDQGAPVAEVTIDYDGAARTDAAPDAGAFEFGGVSVPGNTAPTVTITSPTNSASFSTTASITFSGTAADVEDGNLAASIAWTSSLQGSIGTGATFARTLVAGTHLITATITDSAGASSSASVTIVVGSGSTSSGISIAATGYLVSGLEKAAITWSGAKTTRVDIYRNGKRLVTVRNDGAYIDPINLTTPGTYIYQVCQRLSTVCSATANVVF